MSKKYNYNGDWDWTDLTDPIPNEIMEKFEIKESPFKKKETKPTFKLLKGMSINGKPLSETLKEVINE
jgi:hypothetical protein|tara:strand:+ start:1351 stop:1554 length:204 start_codon:yes stop_codon:yes gene_type:complete